MLYIFVDNYAVARAKASKAENTSDLNTDEGEINAQMKGEKRRIRRKKVFPDSEDDSNYLKKRKTFNMPDPPSWTPDITDTEKNISDTYEGNLISKGKNY